MNGPKVDPTKEIPPSRFMRFRLPLSKGGKGPDDACPIGLPDAVGEAELEAGWEFPVFNEAWRGKESRFSWGCCARRPARYLNALAKVDAVTGDVKTWCDPGAIPGEPCFVARPGAEAEDDG